MPILAMLAYVALANRNRMGKLIMLGLALSLVGDVVLEWPFDLFIAGLVSFLLGHIAYIVAFTLEAPVWKPMKALFPAIYGGAALTLLSPGVGDMLVPVVFYVLVICVMLWRAWTFAGERSDRAGKLALAGAILFVLSDTVLAINRFREPLPGAQYIIILLYWAGQLGIALSTQRPGTFRPESATLFSKAE
jgi:uncharacterized membrane protein YhhN